MSDALPIGTVHITRDKDFNPNTTKNNLFVGKWEKINSSGLYPVATTNGSPSIKLTGNNDVTGSNTHTLTNNQMPKHRHAIAFASRDANDSGVTDIEENQWHFIGNPSGMWPSNWGIRLINSGRVSINSRYQGNSEPHNNQPYSFLTNMWIRVS